MIVHKLHKEIGENLKLLNFEKNSKLILDQACGGIQHIPLFINKNKSNKTEICNVDALILKDQKIKVIIEIEEANIKPTQILGKFMTSALSKYYIHNNELRNIEMDENVLFIQVLDTTKLKENKTSKFGQFKHIAEAIENILPIKDSKINFYKLLFGINFKDIGNIIKDFIKDR